MLGRRSSAFAKCGRLVERADSVAAAIPDFNTVRRDGFIVCPPCVGSWLNSALEIDSAGDRRTQERGFLPKLLLAGASWTAFVPSPSVSVRSPTESLARTEQLAARSTTLICEDDYLLSGLQTRLSR